MKKSSISCALILSGLLASGPSAAPVAEGPVDRFPGSYDEARAKLTAQFAAVRRGEPSAEIGAIPVPSATDADLTVDWLYLPARVAPERLVIFTSAVHGIEGFAGSAVESLFLDEVLPGLDRSRLSVLVIHAVNPWGYRHLRRVDEHNVDLCRNWDISDDLFRTENPGYDRLASYLNPVGPVTAGCVADIFRSARLLALAAYHGMGTLRQAILQGQYRHPAGLYFGGQSFSFQHGAVGPLLQRLSKLHQKVLLLDVHTGYGEPGHLHLFPSDITDPRADDLMKKLFAGFPIDSAGNNSQFYSITGDFGTYVAKIQEPSVVCVPMTLEFGTIGNLSIRGSLRSATTMIVENQGFHHGYETPEDRSQIGSLFRELYFPSAPAWRTAVLHQAREILPVVLKRLHEL